MHIILCKKGWSQTHTMIDGTVHKYINNLNAQWSDLAVSCRENGPQDLSVFPHFLKFSLQSTLYMSIGHHVFHHILLQSASESSIVGVVKLEPV